MDSKKPGPSSFTPEMWAMMLSAMAETEKRHPRVHRMRNRSVEHSLAYIECVSRVSAEITPDFHRIVLENLKHQTEKS